MEGTNCVDAKCVHFRSWVTLVGNMAANDTRHGVCMVRTFGRKYKKPMEAGDKTKVCKLCQPHVEIEYCGR